MEADRYAPKIRGVHFYFLNWTFVVFYELFKILKSSLISRKNYSLVGNVLLFHWFITKHKLGLFHTLKKNITWELKLFNPDSGYITKWSSFIAHLAVCFYGCYNITSVRCHVSLSSASDKKWDISSEPDRVLDVGRFHFSMCFHFGCFRLNSPHTSAIILDVLGHQLQFAQV